MGTDHNGDQMAFCHLEFNNEHNIPLAPIDGIVVLRSYGATLEPDPTNILPDDLNPNEWEDAVEEITDELNSTACGFDIYNGEEIAERIRAQLETTQ
jgi:hypothetical protein